MQSNVTWTQWERAGKRSGLAAAAGRQGGREGGRKNSLLRGWERGDQLLQWGRLVKLHCPSSSCHCLMVVWGGEGRRESRFSETYMNRTMFLWCTGVASRLKGKWVQMRAVYADTEERLLHNSHQINVSSTHIHLQPNANMAIGHSEPWLLILARVLAHLMLRQNSNRAYFFWKIFPLLICKYKQMSFLYFSKGKNYAE